MEKTLQSLQNFLKENIPPNKTIVVPFSGGLNSSTIFSILRTIYPPERIFLLHATSDFNGVETEHAKAIANQYKTPIHFFNLKNLKSSYDQTLMNILNKEKEEYVKSKVFRVTDSSNMIYSIARSVTREVSGFLVGTVDLTEILTGYHAKECFSGDFLPMAGLTRGELRELAKLAGITYFLPERWAPMPGCGNIAPDVSMGIKKIGGQIVFNNEDELEKELRNFINELPNKDNEFAFYIKSQLHKIRVALFGRPVFFHDEERKRKVFNFIS